MAHSSSITQLPVSHVQTLTSRGTTEAQGHVYCTRRGETLSVEACAHCPRFLRVSTRDHGATSVLCSAGERELQSSLAPPALALPRLPVSAIMTRNIVCVRPDLTLDAVTQLFLESGLKAVPVVDAEGKLIGFVSEADVLLEVHASQGASVRAVGEVMMPYTLTLPETAQITRAAAMMAFEGQQRLAVVSRAGAVVGVVSASDILYFLARADGHALPRPRPR
jgi:CBS domain-containing protein